MNLAKIAGTLRMHTPTDEELTAADVLDAVHNRHTSAAGECQRCSAPWPCQKRRNAEALAVRALGWAVDRHIVRSTQTLEKHAKGRSA